MYRSLGKAGCVKNASREGRLYNGLWEKPQGPFCYAIGASFYGDLMSDKTDPHTFNAAIEKFKTWSEFRLDGPAARLLVEHCLAVLRSPHEFPEVVLFWNTFFDVIQPQIQERLESTDWSGTEGRALIFLSIGSIETRKGIRNFLPPTALSGVDKEALWAWHLLNQGYTLQPLDPYCLLRPSALLFMAGSYAAREIEQRARKHPLGFTAGTIGYFWTSDDGKTQEAEEVILIGLKRIGGTARGKIPSAIRPKRDEGKTASGVLDNKLGPLEEQVVDTLLKDFFRGTGPEILARSLDGILDVVPLAVARDVIDQSKNKQAEYERGIQFESDIEEIKVRIEEYPTEIESENNVLAFTERYIERIREFLLKHPQYRELYDARYGVGGLSQSELAEKHGITDRAIRKRTDKFEDDLRKWLGISTPLT
jgi:hypothetical protein